MKRLAASFPVLTPNKRHLIKNVLSLSVLQGLNYLLPLIVMPVLLKSLGVNSFGLLSYVQAFIQYFVIVIDYGFDLSGVQQIARNRGNQAAIESIVTHILVLKLTFFLICFLVLLALVHFVPVFRANQQLFLIGYGVALGQLLMPIWFFQGMEQMKFVTLVHVSSKLVYASLIIALVREPHDLILVPVLQSTGIVVAGGLSLSLLWRKFRLRPSAITIAGLRYQLQEGWFVFISNLSISAYTISNTFFLGLLAGNTAAGYYSAAERVVRAVQGLYIPISQTLFPYLSKILHESGEKMVILLRKVARFTFLGATIVSILLALGAPLLGRIVLGDNLTPNEFDAIVTVLRLLSPLPLLVCLSNVFGIQTMLNLGYRRQFFIILSIASILNMALVPFMAKSFKHNGVAVLLILTEFLVTCMMYLFLRRKGLKLL